MTHPARPNQPLPDAATAERWALVIEDHPLYGDALVRTVQRAGIELQCRTAAGLQEAQRVLARHGSAALLLCDHCLPDGDGLDFLTALAEAAPVAGPRTVQGALPTRRVLLSGHDDPTLAQRAHSAGLDGFVPKTLGPDEMLLALRHVMAGGSWFPRNGVAPPQLLTQRQLEVLREAGRGLSNREIANRLGVGERTVKDHLSIIFVRLGASNRTEAVSQAAAQGLLRLASLQAERA